MVFGKAEREDGALSCAKQNQRTKSTGAAFIWTREALLDYAATQVGVNQTAFGALDSFAQRFIADALASGKAREQDVLVEGSFGLGAFVPIDYSTRFYSSLLCPTSRSRFRRRDNFPRCSVGRRQGEKRQDEAVGRVLELGDERAAGRRGCYRTQPGICVMLSSVPDIYLIGGPNGAGKTTNALRIFPALGVRHFINADAIAQGLSPLDVAGAARATGRLMLEQMEMRLARGDNFALESTLASRSLAPFIVRCKAAGYKFTLIYVWLRDEDLAVQRVKSGGHDIPGDVIRRRYVGATNFSSCIDFISR